MARESEPKELESGDSAPEFELPEGDGKIYTLDSFSDQDALLVVFMCNHCPYVQAKFETMNGIAADYDEVAVVGINPNDAEAHPEDSFDTMIEYVQDGTIDISAYLRDENQAVAKSYGAVCTPDPFLFRNDDEFRLAYHGRFDDAMNPDDEPTREPGFEMREAIDAVLDGEQPEETFRPSRGCSIKWNE